MRLALGHRSVRGLILLLVGLLTLWSVAGFLLSRQLTSRQATTVGAALASVQAIVATAFEDVRREAWLLSQDPAVVEGTNRSDWATLARGAGPRMQALTRERFADLLLIVDATGTPLVQVPVARPVLVPAMARPRETVARLAVVDERLYVLGIAPLPSGMVVVGRRFEALEASLARLPTRAALVVVSGDRALGSTLAGAPTQGWEAVVRAGEMSIKGESWTLRPVAEAGGSLWVLVSERDHHGESWRLWFWWAVSLCGAVAAAVGVVVVGMVWGRSSAPTDGEARKGSLFRNARASELAQPLKVTNTGEGTLQAVVSVSGAPTVPEPAAEKGFKIERLYYTLEGKPADPAKAKQNDRFAVVLKITEPQPRFGRVIVADYLPAGFEIDNPRLVSSGDTGTLSWIEDAQEPANAEFRDDRFSAAFDRKSSDASVFTVAYVVRAVSPGRYMLPQAYVEDMYRPDRFGRTGSGTIEITAAR